MFFKKQFNDTEDREKLYKILCTKGVAKAIDILDSKIIARKNHDIFSNLVKRSIIGNSKALFNCMDEFYNSLDNKPLSIAYEFHPLTMSIDLFAQESEVDESSEYIGDENAGNYFDTSHESSDVLIIQDYSELIEVYKNTNWDYVCAQKYGIDYYRNSQDGLILMDLRVFQLFNAVYLKGEQEGKLWAEIPIYTLMDVQQNSYGMFYKIMRVGI